MARTRRPLPPLTPETTWLTPPEVCAAFTISRDTLQAWERRGLPTFRLGGVVRYNQAALFAWVDQHSEFKTGCPVPAGQVA